MGLGVAFLGSAPFATPVLERLLESRHRIAALVTPPDRPRGRGRGVFASPLVELGRARELALLQPESARDPGFAAALRALAPDVLVVASYGEILRQEVLDLAAGGALNVHASLLPRWRGASPVQRAILAGDRTSGVSVQRMVAALDRGDVLLSLETPIGERETAGELAARLAELGGEAAVRALDRIEDGTARFTPQDEARATYAKKLSKGDGEIDWARSAEELARFVRAMTPWPGARTTLPDGRDLILLEVRPSAGPPGAEPGRVLPAVLMAEPAFLVATAEGALELERVRPAGRPAMEGAAFLRGARLPQDARLGAGRP